MERSDQVVDDDTEIDRAHYIAARVFPMDLAGDEDLGPYWDHYLRAYAGSLGVGDPLLGETVEHLRNEFVSGALWSHVIDGSKVGLAELVATGVPVGIVSNSDGTIERRLRSMGILQVGQGPGVDVRCVVDSGSVGIEKPDPRIFDYALEHLGIEAEGVWYVGDTPGFDVVGARRAGIKPLLMDPFSVNHDFGADTVTSLGDVARMVAAT